MTMDQLFGQSSSKRAAALLATLLLPFLIFVPLLARSPGQTTLLPPLVGLSVARDSHRGHETGPVAVMTDADPGRAPAGQLPTPRVVAAVKRETAMCKGHNPWQSRIEQDLQPFREHGITESLVDLAKYRAEASGVQWIEVAIRSGKIYYKLHNWEDLQRLQHLALLLFANQCARFPDLDLVMSTSDFPICKHAAQPVAPMFGWNKHQTLDCEILWPWEDLIANNRKRSKALSKRKDWSRRVNTAIFRGSSTGGPVNNTPATWKQQYRARAVLFCRSHKELCDAEFTSLWGCDDACSKAMLSELSLAPRTTIEEESQHKSVLLLEGNGAPASRSVKAFNMGFTVLKQESPLIEFWYGILNPWVNYIPLSHELDDLEEKLTWVQNHDQEATQLAQNAEMLALQNLTDICISCYVIELLNDYVSLLQYEPRPLVNDESSEWREFKLPCQEMSYFTQNLELPKSCRPSVSCF